MDRHRFHVWPTAGIGLRDIADRKGIAAGSGEADFILGRNDIQACQPSDMVDGRTKQQV